MKEQKLQRESRKGNLGQVRWNVDRDWDMRLGWGGGWGMWMG